MTRDVLDRLRDADPLRDRQLPDATDPAARAMREAVLAGSAVSLDPGRRRRWVTVGAAVAAAAATAAALAITTSPVEDPTSVGCYAAASTQADTVVVATEPGGPVATCAALWAEGVLNPAVTTEDEVPVLVPCVLEEGVVGVFPTGSCEDVVDDALGRTDGATPSTANPDETPSNTPSTGLALPDIGADDAQVRRAIDQVSEALLDRCVSFEAATAIAREALADHGLDGWTVGSVLDEHPDGTCSGFFPDVSDRAMLFVPEEPEPGQTPEG